MSLDSYANLKLEIADHLERDDLTTQIDTFIDLAEARHKREVRIKEMMVRTYLLSSTSSVITGVTKANPAVVTSTSHGRSDGDRVYITSVGGMVEINDLFFIVANKTDNTFELTGIDSSAYTTYTTGGVSTLAGISNRQEPLPSDYLEMINLRILTSPLTIVDEVNYQEMNRLRVEGSGLPKHFVTSNELEFDYAPDSAYKTEIVYWQEQTALSDTNTSNDILVRAPDLYLYGALTAAEPFLMNDARIATWANLYLSGLATLNTVDRRRGGLLVSRPAGMVY